MSEIVQDVIPVLMYKHEFAMVCVNVKPKSLLEMFVVCHVLSLLPHQHYSNAEVSKVHHNGPWIKN